jgi:hypothetical protein
LRPRDARHTGRAQGRRVDGRTHAARLARRERQFQHALGRSGVIGAEIDEPAAGLDPILQRDDVGLRRFERARVAGQRVGPDQRVDVRVQKRRQPLEAFDAHALALQEFVPRAIAAASRIVTGKRIEAGVLRVALRAADDAEHHDRQHDERGLERRQPAQQRHAARGCMPSYAAAARA